jgi:hypothetical protein
VVAGFGAAPGGALPDPARDAELAPGLAALWLGAAPGGAVLARGLAAPWAWVRPGVAALAPGATALEAGTAPEAAVLTPVPAALWLGVAVLAPVPAGRWFGAAVGAAGLAPELAGLWLGVAVEAAPSVLALAAPWAGAGLGAAVLAPVPAALWFGAAWGVAGLVPGVAALVGGAASEGCAPGGAAALGSAVAAVLVLARDVSGFARVLPGLLPDCAAGVFFAFELAVVPDRELAAVVFDRAPDPDPGLVPAAGNPEAAAAGAEPPAVVGWVAASVASALPWSRSAAAASAARGRLAALVWLSVPADCLLAARLWAGSVPCPAELSPRIPFSEVTAP